MDKIGDVLPLLERAYSFGLRDRHIVELTGISTGTMSRAKNGTTILPAQDWLDCKNLVLECEELSRRSPLPIDWSDLRSVRSQLEALRDEKRNPPAAPDEDDWALLSLISDGNLDSAGVAANLGISLSELSSRLTEANRKFEYSIRQMRSWNADRAALTAIRDQETENLRSRKQVDSQS